MTYDTFTDCEKRVADKLLLGLSNNEIALQLRITVQTVKFHLTKLYRKAGTAQSRHFIVKVLTEEFSRPRSNSNLT